jgi:putative endonuclease
MGRAQPESASATAAAAGPPAWVYLLRCADGSLYCGWTVDLDARLERHATGAASAYTRSRLPVELVLALAMPDRRAARREEARIKRLDRRAKLALIAAPQRRRQPAGEAVEPSAPSTCARTAVP